MKIKEIILDFTSLLDVTLIILFFFILFSHIETEDARTEAAEQIANAEAQMEAAGKRMEEAEALYGQLSDELELVRQSDERRGSDMSAILEYNRGSNVKMYLDMVSDGWELRVFRENQVLSVIRAADDIEAVLGEALNANGYQSDETLFCDFVYNGSEPGTVAAYRRIERAVRSMKQDYPYFYYSETDISTGEE